MLAVHLNNVMFQVEVLFTDFLVVVFVGADGLFLFFRIVAYVCTLLFFFSFFYL